jgi:CRISPR/Cas system CSM-associated protein Csm3 (group 7 of RAMP superfamily)
LRVDAPPHHDEVLEALLTWRPVIGGGRTTGHGTTRTLAVRSAVIDLSTTEGRRLWLTTGGPALFDAVGLREHELPRGAGPESCLPALHWHIVDPLHVGSGEHRSGESARLLRDHSGCPYVPGTSWKGLLRSRTAHILRSLGHDVCTDTACGGCPVCVAFGWTGTDANGARGVLRFPDTPITTGEEQITERQHVAVNRFTGGAADALLFSEEVVEQGELTLNIGADGTIPRSSRAALVLALCDLHDGIIGVGGGVTRGNGTLACTSTATLEALRNDARKVLTS